MISRFSIPNRIQKLIKFRETSLLDLDELSIENVNKKIIALRGNVSISPEITIAIIAYDEEINLFATLKSLSIQITDLNVEIILVDNNSTDNTSTLARLCGATVFLEEKQGAAFARQKALEKASGTYYVSCDGDTIYPEQWLQTLVNPLIKKDDVSVTYSLHVLIDENKSYPISLYAYQYAKLFLIFIRSKKRGQLNCGGAGSAFRVKDAERVGGYNTLLKRGSDGYIALQLSSIGNIKLVSKKEAFIYTSNRRMLKDGSILNSFFIRFKYGMRHMFSFLSTQKIPTA